MMILAMLTLSTVDAISRGLADTLPPLQVVWMRYVGQTAIIGLLILPRLASVLRTDRPGLHLTRASFLFVATTLLVSGFAAVGLAQSTATLMINPLLVTLGAMLFLGERVGPRRLFGAVIGLAGALLIIRPGSAVFTLGALLPLGAAFMYMGYMLTTRLLPPRENIWTSLIYTTLVGAIALTPPVLLVWQPMDTLAWSLLVVMGMIGALGQFFLIRALALADASAVAPFSYVNLVVATFYGVVIFSERVDFWTATGALVIVGSGLYVWHRERQSRQSAGG